MSAMLPQEGLVANVPFESMGRDEVSGRKDGRGFKLVEHLH